MLNTDYKRLAEIASMTCFLNSLLREWFDWSYDGNEIHIPLASDVISIPVRYYSLLGRHEYEYPAHLGKEGPLTFTQLKESLINHLDLNGSTNSDAKKNFSLRVEDSLKAMEELLEHRANDFPQQPTTFVEAEQYLVVGHSFHPSPKSREGFSKSDRFRYGPEYAGAFPLHWFAAHDSIIRMIASQTFGTKDWVAELAKSDPKLSALLDRLPKQDFQLYPMNPWQANYLRRLPTVRDYLEQGLLIDLGEEGDDWYPTSSVRAISRPASPYMLKTSLNVRLTNSVRTLLKKEVDRGIQAHDVFESSHGKAFQKSFPNFALIAEPAYLYLVNKNGEAMEESIVICRENPFSEDQSKQAFVLASLTQDDPYGGKSLIAQYIEENSALTQKELGMVSREWFQAYLNLVVEPLLMAQAEYGILLGAHQQNILVSIDSGMPVAAYFRDCQGTGYSEFAYEILKDEVQSLDLSNGNVLPSAMTNILFIYYLFINASFNVISTIGRMGHISESELVELMRQKLVDLLRTNPKDPSCIIAALQNPKILHKGNFLCSISDINENTSANPLAIYTAINNPFYQENGEVTLS